MSGLGTGLIGTSVSLLGTGLLLVSLKRQGLGNLKQNILEQKDLENLK